MERRTNYVANPVTNRVHWRTLEGDWIDMKVLNVDAWARHFQTIKLPYYFTFEPGESDAKSAGVDC